MNRPLGQLGELMRVGHGDQIQSLQLALFGYRFPRRYLCRFADC